MVNERKQRMLGELKEVLKKYSVVGIVDMKKMPAKQLGLMRKKLRGSAQIKMAKNRMFVKAIDEVRPELEAIKPQITGATSLILTDMNPFKLAKIIKDSKASAPAKPGDISPRDIKIPAGETSFTAGPILGQLQKAGLPARIKEGKVILAEDTVILKKGEKISRDKADILTKFGIEPMEIGLNLVAAFEKGQIYPIDILRVDEAEYVSRIQKAYRDSLSLSMSVAYPTKQNIALLIGKAFMSARSLGVSAEILEKGVIGDLLFKAQASMYSLASLVGAKSKDALDDELR